MSEFLGSSVASAVAINVEQNARQNQSTAILPQKIAVLGAGSSDVTYSTDPVKAVSATQIGDLFGYGSTLHLVAQQLFSGTDRLKGQTVTMYPVEEPTGSAAATYEIEITGTSTQTAQLVLKVGDFSYSVPVIVGADSATINPLLVDRINGDLDNPFLAEISTDKVLLTAKTKGSWISDLVVSVDGSAEGLTIVSTDLGTGSGYIDAEPALQKIGTSWETIIINTSTVDDLTTLNALQNFGESRWDPLIKKPLISITGSNVTDMGSLRTITDARRSDRINTIVSVPGSRSFAAQIATNTTIIASNTFDSNPSNSAEQQALKNLSAGSDSVQAQFPERDLNTKSGLTSTEVRNSQVILTDFVTAYHPTGEVTPAYRKVVDIIKLMNCEYLLDSIFQREDWAGAPLVPDGQVTSVSVGAKTPSLAKADVLEVCGFLIERAIIADTIQSISDNMFCDISTINSDRLVIIVPVTLSGNFKQADITLQFQFLRG